MENRRGRRGERDRSDFNYKQGTYRNVVDIARIVLKANGTWLFWLGFKSKEENPEERGERE